MTVETGHDALDDSVATRDPYRVAAGEIIWISPSTPGLTKEKITTPSPPPITGPTTDERLQRLEEAQIITLGRVDRLEASLARTKYPI